MAKPEKPNLHRVKHWQGERLKSGDLRDFEETEDQRRWWHNRALHNAYGVAEGMQVAQRAMAPDSVVVSPGLAYDCFGRELVLEAEQVVPLPAKLPDKNSTWRLLVRYQAPFSVPTGGSPPWTNLAPVCKGTVDFLWKQRDSATIADGAPIAEARFSKSELTELISGSRRNTTRPMARPRLASGATIPGNTAWKLWAVENNSDPEGSTKIGVETTIDTSAGGFTEVPVYFAWLEGPLWNPQTVQLVPALFPSLAEEATDSFSFRLWLRRTRPQSVSAPEIRFVGPEEFPAFARQQKLYVSWVGCQMRPDIYRRLMQISISDEIFTLSSLPE